MTSSCHSGGDLLKMGVRLRYLSFLSSANVVSKPQWIYVVIVPLVSPHPWPRFSQHELHLMPILPSRAICTMLLADCSPAQPLWVPPSGLLIPCSLENRLISAGAPYLPLQVSSPASCWKRDQAGWGSYESHKLFYTTLAGFVSAAHHRA